VELLETVRQLARRSTEPTAVVAALHDLNQAAEFCDRLVLLSHGKVEAAGTVEEVMQADILSRVYRAHVQVGKNQLTGHPMLTVIRSTRSADHPVLPKIHVVCGGGSGSAILSALVHGGYRLSTGVLNRLDTDHQSAAALGIEMALAPPFSGFDEHSISDARQLIMQADTVILSSVPFGHGNLANLALVEEAQLQSKRIVLIGDEPFGSRDYANGQATTLFTKILEGGAEQYTTVEGWLDREATNAGNPSTAAPG
jgi:iron complex transport system ATP-binding protein